MSHAKIRHRRRRRHERQLRRIHQQLTGSWSGQVTVYQGLDWPPELVVGQGTVYLTHTQVWPLAGRGGTSEDAQRLRLRLSPAAQEQLRRYGATALERGQRPSSWLRCHFSKLTLRTIPCRPEKGYVPIVFHHWSVVGGGVYAPSAMGSLQQYRPPDRSVFDRHLALLPYDV